MKTRATTIETADGPARVLEEWKRRWCTLWLVPQHHVFIENKYGHWHQAKGPYEHPYDFSVSARWRYHAATGNPDAPATRPAVF